MEALNAREDSPHRQTLRLCQIVEAHGGTIEARSDGEVKGAAFFIRLAPEAHASNPVADIIPEEPS